MPGRDLLRGTFAQLEAEFIARVRALRDKSPLAPCAVLVPNHLLRLHLQRALADAGRPHANIHFLTLANLANKLGGARLGLTGLRPAPPHFQDLALIQAVERNEGRLQYFGPVANQEGFRAALLGACRELKEAGLGPDDLRSAAVRLPSGPNRIFKAKLQDAALLWEHVETCAREGGFYDDADLAAAAAAEAPSSAWLKGQAAFVVYGFYDLTGLQMRLLRACFACAPATAYFPYCETQAFRYARPALDWFIANGFEPRDAREAPGCEATDLARLQRNVFAPPAGDVGAAPGDAPGFLIVSAPGEAREVEEVVREALHPAGAEQDDLPKRIGILLRSRSPYAELLHETFSAVDVTGYFHHGLPLRRCRAARSLLLLAGLVGGALKRADVMEFVTTARLRRVGSAGEEVSAARAATLDYFSIEAGIVEGPKEWLRRLDRPIESAKKKAEPGDDENEDPGEELSPEERASLKEFREFIAALFEGIEDVARQRTWRGMAETFARTYALLVAEDEDTPATLAAMRELAELDALGEPATVERFRGFLTDSLTSAARPQGRFERNEPTVSDLMEARGVPFDLVIVPGMVEKVFPRPSRQDPILLDSERLRLASLVSKRGQQVHLPAKRMRGQEEELLFTLAVQAARAKVVLTWPRLDEGKARPRIASHFLLRALEAVTGEDFDYDALERFAQSDPRGRFVRMSRLDPSVRDRAATTLEYDLSSLEKARQDNAPDALAYLTQVTPFFAQALQAETARWESGVEFTEYDGVVRSPALLAGLRERLHDSTTAISPTRLERYASCPFSYLMGDVFGIEPVEEPEQAYAISALDRGSLIHRILWEFLSEVVRDGELPLSAAHWDRLERIARARFARFEAAGVTGFPLMWRIETERVLADLREFLRQETADASGFAPAHFEVRFGMRPHDREESPLSTAEPVLFDLDDGEAVRFRGKIDRIDVRRDAKRSRVTDYKTGSAFGPKDDSFDGGRALQLPVYLIAAEQLLKESPPDYARYYYASARGGWRTSRFTREGWDAKRKTLRTIVRAILDGIRSGRFYARGGAGACAWCDYQLACGHGRSLNFKWDAAQEATRAFKAMEEIE